MGINGLLPVPGSLYFSRKDLEMEKWFDRLRKDVRFSHSLHSCINCGTCTAICPAASFYNYDPREIADALQVEDEQALVELLSGETIWMCGQCMSCKTRCPRDNTPGLLILALRNLSIESGLYMKSVRGRQMYALKKMLGETILATGYCVHADRVDPSLHPELGPIWKWIMKHRPEIYNMFGNSYNKSGDGALRKIMDETLDEIRKIFEVTGTSERFRMLEKDAEEKARQEDIEFDETLWNEYFRVQYSEKPESHES